MRAPVCDYTVSTDNPLRDPRAKAWLCRYAPWTWENQFAVLWVTPGSEVLGPFLEWERERWHRLSHKQQAAHLWEAIQGAHALPEAP